MQLCLLAFAFSKKLSTSLVGEQHGEFSYVKQPSDRCHIACL